MNTNPNDPELCKYREHLVAADERAQENFDKTVISLAGGALGVSFAFLDNVVKDHLITCPSLLAISWLSWTASLTTVLVSFFLSHLALQKAIKQVDSGQIHGTRPGGRYAVATKVCNVLSAALFLFGLVCMGVFVLLNLG
jgi:hypothetical protein